MKVEDTHALRFILQDELYLLNEDKSWLQGVPVTQPGLKTQQPVFNYLGSNKKKILLLVSYEAHDLMNADHLAALESVLGRLGHTLDDVAILNLAKSAPATYDELAAFFSPRITVILGKDAIPAGSGDLPFNTIAAGTGTSLLYTFSFDEMMADVNNKKAFWEQMKNLSNAV